MIMHRIIPDIAIIGAGPAGLACAERLAEHGLQVQVYDEGRQPGGRVAVQRHVGLAFEPGAAGQRATIDRLAARVPVLARARITRLERAGEIWRLHIADLPLSAVHTTVVLAVPAPRAVALLPRLAPLLQGVRMRPALTALLGLAGPLSRTWEQITFASGNLAEARRQAPGRPSAPEAWVLQASAVFSEDNLECDPDTVAQHLWQCFRSALALDVTTPSFLRGHRWRHALTVAPLGQSCWWDDDLGLGLCGDWCLGDGVDAAVTSGQTLAARMLGMVERPPRISLAAGGDLP